MYRFDTPAAVLLTVDNAAGSVRVDTHGEPVTTVELTALSDDADDLVERAAVTHEKSGGSDVVTIRVPHPQGRGLLKMFARGEVGVVARVPEGADLTVAVASADVAAAGTYRAVDVRSASGDVRVHRSDRLRVRTASGDIDGGTVTDDARLESASGDQRVAEVGGRVATRSASGEIEVGRAGAGVEATSASGDVHVRDVSGDVSVTTASGDVTLDVVRDGRITLRSMSGDVSMGVAAGRRLEVDIQTMSGDADSQIPLSGDDTGTVDGPLVVVHARTVSGDVRIRRADEAAVAG
jgi:hypothetical protein